MIIIQTEVLKDELCSLKTLFFYQKNRESGSALIAGQTVIISLLYFPVFRRRNSIFVYNISQDFSSYFIFKSAFNRSLLHAFQVRKLFFSVREKTDDLLPGVSSDQRKNNLICHI